MSRLLCNVWTHWILPTVREWFNAINNKQLIFVYNVIRTNQSQLDFSLPAHTSFMNIYEWFTLSAVCAELSVRYDIIQYLINQNVTWQRLRGAKGDKGEIFDCAGLFRFFFRWHKEVVPLPPVTAVANFLYLSLSLTRVEAGVGVPPTIMWHLLYAFHLSRRTDVSAVLGTTSNWSVVIEMCRRSQWELSEWAIHNDYQKRKESWASEGTA